MIYRLGMNLGHRSEPIRQRRRAAGEKSQSLKHPVEFESMVEPIGKFCQVVPRCFPTIAW